MSKRLAIGVITVTAEEHMWMHCVYATLTQAIERGDIPDHQEDPDSVGEMMTTFRQIVERAGRAVEQAEKDFEESEAETKEQPPLYTDPDGDYPF